MITALALLSVPVLAGVGDGNIDGGGGSGDGGGGMGEGTTAIPHVIVFLLLYHSTQSHVELL